MQIMLGAVGLLQNQVVLMNQKAEHSIDTEQERLSRLLYTEVGAQRNGTQVSSPPVIQFSMSVHVR